MILRNKLTKETLNISYSEFRKRFARELQVALRPSQILMKSIKVC